jgi:predicted PurR-regulated permease PerM
VSRAVQDPRSDDRVPQGLRVTAAWSWRLLVILAVVVVAALVMARLQVLFVGVFVALLLTALLEPAAARLRRWGLPRVLATASVLLGGVVVVGLVAYLVGRAVLGQVDEFEAAITEGIETVRIWVDTTFGMSLEQIGEWIRERLGSLEGGGSGLTDSVFGFAATALEVVAGAGIALFATIFFVHDGPGIWAWFTRLFPTGARAHVQEAGGQSWQTLAAYARGTVMIAAIDAIGIGAGVALVGVPLAGPIAVLVFFGAFIPIVGALLSGMVAVLIALATQGLTAALLVTAIVIGVQQVEGHILQPLIQGRMVALHPLVVVLAVAGGSTVAGLVGAIIAVPVVAVLNVLIKYAARVSRGNAEVGGEGEPGDGGAARAEAAPGGVPTGAAVGDGEDPEPAGPPPDPR